MRFVAAEGLMSYGINETEYDHHIGTCVRKILGRDKPGDLPGPTVDQTAVRQSTWSHNTLPLCG
jgi:hypothetical protein